MEGVNRVESSQVDTLLLQQLTPLVDKRTVPLLQGEHPIGLSFGHTERWVYTADQRPVGLLLISVIPKYQTGVVDWLMVEESYRGRGVASQLFEAALKHLKELEIKVLTVYFPKNVGFSPAIESLLQKFHWELSKLFVQKIRFYVPEFNPPWLHLETPLPEGYSFFPWGELTPKEIADLEHRFDQYQIPGSLNPFRLPELVHQGCSVGIRTKERVVAWSVCHWYDANNMEFSTLYVEPELTLLGLGIQVLAKSILLLKVRPPDNAWMIIRVLDDPIPAWSNFVRKRLAVLAEEIQDIHEANLLIK